MMSNPPYRLLSVVLSLGKKRNWLSLLTLYYRNTALFIKVLDIGIFVVSEYFQDEK